MPHGSIVSANLVYRDRPVLILESGEEIVDDKNEITYEMTHEWIVDEKGETKQVPLSRPVRVYLTPYFTTTRKYSQEAIEDELDIYPPSSHGFYGRLVRGEIDVLYCASKIVESSNFWLVIKNPTTQEIHESHQIQHYEFDALRLKKYYEIFDELLEAFSPSNPTDIINNIVSPIDNERLSWEDISNLTKGMNIPSNLKRGTARSVLEQLIPIQKFPIDKQDEILAFLFWVAKDQIPEIDIIEFLDTLHILDTFRSLYAHHLRFKIEKIQPPSYIRIIHDITSTELVSADSDLEERLRWKPDFLLRRKVQALSPDWQAEIAKILHTLNNTRRITTILPIPKSSKKSQTVQRSRLIMYDMGLHLRAHVRTISIGLRELIYIGAAHRWPHWHLAYSFRLGSLRGRSPYMQGMIMPSSAAEQVKRVLPSTIEVLWSTRTHNPNLFSFSKNHWTLKLKPIQASINKSLHLNKLQKEFGNWDGTSAYQLSTNEARILDMASTMFYLSDLESDAGKNYWQTDETQSREILTTLRDVGILDIGYWYDRPLTLSLIIMSIQGEEEQVCSITYAILKNTPTSMAKVTEDKKTAIVLSRVPRNDLSSLVDILTQINKNERIEITHWLPTAHRNYAANLYHRLLNTDSSWNNDVSGFLSQVRSAPKSVKDDVVKKGSERKL